MAVATLLFIFSFTVTYIHNYIRTIHSFVSIHRGLSPYSSVLQLSGKNLPGVPSRDQLSDAILCCWILSLGIFCNFYVSYILISSTCFMRFVTGYGRPEMAVLHSEWSAHLQPKRGGKNIKKLKKKVLYHIYGNSCKLKAEWLSETFLCLIVLYLQCVLCMDY